MAQCSGLSSSVVGSSGSDGQPALVLLHGYTQTGESWTPVLAHMPPAAALLPDAPGHGGSASVRADMWTTADMLAALVSRPCTWVGYSMGGRAALHVALAHPETVDRLVLVSTSPGIADPVARAQRVESDERLAQRIEADGDAGLPRFLDEWLATPLFRALPREAAGMSARLANTASGLASSLRLAGAGAQDPLWARLGELGQRQLPVLLVTGQLDSRYCGLARQMADAIGPLASTVIVAGAGHACHLEKPAEVAALVANFAGIV